MYRFIGASIGHCAGILGCQEAPDLVKEKLNLHDYWQKTVYYNSNKRKLDAVDDLASFSNELAEITKEVINSGYKHITIGGDHSCAIGTWSGAYEACGEFGLIWIDAHMDAHIPASSHSGNLHGMSIASLMGCGDDKLTKILSERPKLKSENIVLIGVRSFELPEHALLKKLGAKIFMMNDVHEKGFSTCFNQALNDFQNKNLPYGISFDLDGLDPHYIQALGTPVENGIALQDIISAFRAMPKKSLIGLEITEYNPSLGKKYRGVDIIKRVIDTVTENKYKKAIDYVTENKYLLKNSDTL